MSRKINHLKITQAMVVILGILLISLFSCREKSQNNQANNKVSTTEVPTAIYKTSLINPTIDKNIRSIFQDRKGNYWVGTNGAGVYRYDLKTVTQYTVKDGLADTQVINIQEDDLGHIWFVGSGFTISKFDGNIFSTHNQNIKLSNGTKNDWASKNNDLWFYAGGGVVRYSDETFVYLPFDKTDSNIDKNSPFKLSRFGVYCILKDTKGNIWFGTQAEGVCRYDGQQLTWFKEKGLAGPAVLGLFEDSKGKLWFGNNGAGLFYYDGQTLSNFTKEKGLDNPDFRVSGKPGLGTLARVYTINEDNNGNIWIGTVDAGVWKFDGNNLTNFTTKDGLTSNAVNTIYKDRHGELWFGTDSHGICKFNGTTFDEFSEIR